jgi:hypothetical protein
LNRSFKRDIMLDAEVYGSCSAGQACGLAASMVCQAHYLMQGQS